MPTVLDRFLQQALSQVLSPVFETSFSDRSFGFRPGRSAHQAVEAARRAIEDGLAWVVDVDLDRFFDRVQHDALMARVARRVDDRRVLRLIRRYLDAGVMVAGVKMATTEGTPQGSPLSPLLANIMLDDLDHELERRGHPFVRYADDLRVYVASERAAARVLEGRHDLRGAAAQAQGEPREERGRSRDPPRPPRLRLLQARGQGEGQARPQGEASPEGSTTPPHLPAVEHRDAGPARAARPVPRWLGRLLRAGRDTLGVRRARRVAPPPVAAGALEGMEAVCLRGVATSWPSVSPTRQARQWAASRKGYWRVSGSPVLGRALPNAYWADLGLVPLGTRTARLREHWRTAGCGPARPVVWEGAG